MNNFEKITASLETLGDFLASLMAVDTPWEDAFHKTFCTECGRDNCDEKPCPFQKERDNPTWWLNQTERGKTAPTSEMQERQEGSDRPVDNDVFVEKSIEQMESHLRVLIRVAKIENPFGEMPTGKEVGARLETAWQTAEEVKKVHPNAEISVEVEV